MSKDINQRLQDLREVMRREHLAAFIFPSTDPHQSEYVADHWKGREFISGFNGSAGTAVVTMSGAALWTDSRYFIAAAEQLRGTEFQLMRLKMPGTPTIAEWIASDCSTKNEPCTEVGIDGMVSSCAEVRELITELRRHGGFTLRTNIEEVSKALMEELDRRLEMAGIDVIDSRLTHLAYAPEIAQAMLRRQQAEAIIAARKKIVEGAVGMVEMAVEMLSEGGNIDLDDERKATMATNLMVVLCGESEAQPVLNTGTLYN